MYGSKLFTVYPFISEKIACFVNKNKINIGSYCGNYLDERAN